MAGKPAVSYESLGAFIDQVFPTNVTLPTTDRLFLIEGIRLTSAAAAASSSANSTAGSDDISAEEMFDGDKTHNGRQLIQAANNIVNAYAAKIQSSTKSDEYIIWCVRKDYPSSMTVKRFKLDNDNGGCSFMKIEIVNTCCLVVPLSSVSFERTRRPGKRLSTLIDYQLKQQQFLDCPTVLVFAFTDSRYRDRRDYLNAYTTSSSTSRTNRDRSIETNRGFPNDRFVDKFGIIVLTAKEPPPPSSSSSSSSPQRSWFVESRERDAATISQTDGDSDIFHGYSQTTNAEQNDYDDRIISVTLGSNAVKISSYHHDNRVTIKSVRCR